MMVKRTVGALGCVLTLTAASEAFAQPQPQQPQQPTIIVQQQPPPNGQIVTSNGQQPTVIVVQAAPWRRCGVERCPPRMVRRRPDITSSSAR